MKKNAGVPWPDPDSKTNQGGSYKGPGGSGGGSMSRGMPPLKRAMEPGSMKKAKAKPVSAKPTRFDNRKVSK